MFKPAITSVSHGHALFAGRKAQQRSLAQVEDAAKALPMPSGQVIGAQSIPSTRLDLLEQRQRLAHFAVHLVDEGDDGRVARAADLQQLARLRLDALGRVDHHHRRVDRGQHAIGVFREILVARCVQQVDDVAARSRTASRTT